MTPDEMRALAVDCVKDDGSQSDEWLIRMSGNAALWSSAAEVCDRLDTMRRQTKPRQRTLSEIRSDAEPARVGNQTLDYKRGVQGVVAMMRGLNLLSRYCPSEIVAKVREWAKREGMEIE